MLLVLIYKNKTSLYMHDVMTAFQFKSLHNVFVNPLGGSQSQSKKFHLNHKILNVYI